MHEMSISGLLHSLPTTNPYQPPDYVPVPLTGVRVNVSVVNFIAQVILFNGILDLFFY